MERKADIDVGTQTKWILGEDVPGVSYTMGQSVRVVSGPHAGRRGELISLYSLYPEPLFHLESSENEDFRVYQSEIKLDDA